MTLQHLWTLMLAVLSVQIKAQSTQNDINILIENTILSSIDETIKPCEDFYAHACGKYAEQHSSEDYKEITTLLDLQYNKFILQLFDAVYRDYQQDSDKSDTFIAKTLAYFHSCRRETKRNLTKYFEHIKPGPQLNWPLWEELRNNATKPFLWADEQSFDMWTLLGTLQSYGLNNVLINQQILVKKNGDLEIMLEPAYRENNSTLPDLKMLAVLLMGLGVAQPKMFLLNLLQTNKILVDILESCEEHKGNVQQLTYKDLKSQFENLNLSSFVKELVNRELSADTVIILRNPQYFQNLNEKQNVKKSDWCNYLMLKFLYFLALDSTATFKSLDCIKDLRNKMDLAVNYLFYQHNYGHKADLYKPIILEVFQNIKAKFQKLFLENHLNLTLQQQQFLQEKLQYVKLNIGNLPQDVTFIKIEKFYENLPTLDITNYYKNHLLLLKHGHQNTLHYKPNQTHHHYSRGALGSRPAAFYVAQQNMIVLPFSSLRYPLFDIHYHDVYKYSHLGFIMAHELSHSFDTFGLNYDSKGEFVKSPHHILENEHFLTALECLQSQLFTNSIDERIADIIAIDISYDLHETKLNKDTPADVRTSWNKYFYLNLAQFFCGKNDIKFIDHDTDAQRLNQIVTNSKGFELVFQCDRNSKMNTSRKCRIY